MVGCPECGSANPAGARFCNGCGAALVDTRAIEVRKTVSVLFCDLVGSTALSEKLDPEAARSLLGRYFDAARHAIEIHGGTVEKFIGDAVMAVFGVPLLREDDALRAVRAAHDLRARARGLGLSTRIGVNTGEVVAGDPAAGQSLVTGDAVNVAARLEQAAETDEILLGSITHRLVRDAVRVEQVAPIAAKGKGEALVAYRLLEVLPDEQGLARRMDGPFVARKAELGRLAAIWREVVDQRTCRLLTVVAPAGVGKSRLVREFTHTLQGAARVLHGRCLSYGESITYWPIGEALREAAGIQESDHPDEARRRLAALVTDNPEAYLIAGRVAAAIGLTSEAAPQEEVFWAIRRCLEHLAAQQPVLLIVDDIHWAEATLLDLLEYVVELASGVSLAILCAARPELLSIRPGWSGGMRTEVMHLEPLDGAELDRLLDGLPGGNALPPELQRRVIGAAEGNPLFLEEMVAKLRDEGMLIERAGAWLFDGQQQEVEVPPTVTALIAARLDGLPDEQRDVAQRSAVVGRVFEAAAVRALAGVDGSDVGRTLLALVRKEVLRPETSVLTAGDAFGFRHILLRDAAYEALPKAMRAELHERFALWLERVVGERLAEYEEIVGYHLEQAYRYRRVLGEAGPGVEELAGRAYAHLSAAGRRALARDDFRAARGLLQRALTLTPDSARRAELAPDLGWALLHSGELAALAALLADSMTWSGSGEDPLKADLEILAVHQQMRSLGLTGDPAAQIKGAIARLGSGGHHRQLARAWSLLAWVEVSFGRCTAAVDAARRAAEHGELAQLKLVADRARVDMLRYSTGSPLPAAELLSASEALLADPELGPYARADVVDVYSMALAMSGRIDEARAVRQQDPYAQLGDYVSSYVRAQESYWVERAAGDIRRVEPDLRAAEQGLDQMGEAGYRSTILAMLAHVLCAQGDYVEALKTAEAARAITVPDDVISAVMWRTAMARALAGQDPPAAARLGDEALSIADGTEYVLERAWARMEVAQALAEGGEPERAQVLLREALEMLEAKGDVGSAAKARAALSAIG